MADLLKVAAVLEAAADYYEENEREKTSAIDTARSSRLDKIAAAHLATHGEELPAASRSKLAKADDAALDVVEDLLSKTGGDLPSLGGGADDEQRAPKNIKEAAEDADTRFLNWLKS